jgi:anion-transporting  ArsA/GET3 family ATPase
VDLRSSLTKSQVRFVVGKGGVGKTTMTAALGLAGASCGLRMQLIELEGRDDIARLFDATEPLRFESHTLYQDPSGGSVSARHLAPDAALTEWLSDHSFARLLPKLRSSGALDVIATAVPGIRDVLVLGKIKALAREGEANVLLVDAPATGHSLSLLASPASLMNAARSGPIRRQAEEVNAMLRDESRSCVSLVTLASELPVTEAVEAAYNLEDRAGVALSTILVNQFDAGALALRAALTTDEEARLERDLRHAVARARQFTLANADEQERQRERLSNELPLPQVVVPHIDTDVISFDRLRELALVLRKSSWP